VAILVFLLAGEKDIHNLFCTFRQKKKQQNLTRKVSWLIILIQKSQSFQQTAQVIGW